MKNFIKIAGITAMVAVIGLSFIGCFGSGGGGSGGSGRASVAPAEDFEYGLIEDGSGVVIGKYIGKGGNIIVPGEIEGFPVKELSDHCFEGTAVTSVALPDSLAPWWIEVTTRNEEEGFYDSTPSFLFARTPIQTVTFPQGITVIPGYIFFQCKELKTFTIPNTVKYLGGNAYTGTGLTSVVIPEGITVISDTFESCEFLTSVTLPESIEEIGGAFTGCRNLVEVNLPSHPFDIYQYAFGGCEKLPLKTRQRLIELGHANF